MLRGLCLHISQSKQCREAFHCTVSQSLRRINNTTSETYENTQEQDTVTPDHAQRNELGQFIPDNPKWIAPTCCSPSNHAGTDEGLRPERSAKRTRATVEDVDDEEAGSLPKRSFVKDFPREYDAGGVLGSASMKFEEITNKQQKNGDNNNSWAAV